MVAKTIQKTNELKLLQWSLFLGWSRIHHVSRQPGAKSVAYRDGPRMFRGRLDTCPFDTRIISKCVPYPSYARIILLPSRITKDYCGQINFLSVAYHDRYLTYPSRVATCSWLWYFFAFLFILKSVDVTNGYNRYSQALQEIHILLHVSRITFAHHS
jgi:hypothetical protein